MGRRVGAGRARGSRPDDVTGEVCRPRVRFAPSRRVRFARVSRRRARAPDEPGEPSLSCWEGSRLKRKSGWVRSAHRRGPGGRGARPGRGRASTGPRGRLGGARVRLGARGPGGGAGRRVRFARRGRWCSSREPGLDGGRAGYGRRTRATPLIIGTWGRNYRSKFRISARSPDSDPRGRSAGGVRRRGRPGAWRGGGAGVGRGARRRRGLRVARANPGGVRRGLVTRDGRLA